MCCGLRTVLGKFTQRELPSRFKSPRDSMKSPLSSGFLQVGFFFKTPSPTFSLSPPHPHPPKGWEWSGNTLKIKSSCPVQTRVPHNNGSECIWDLIVTSGDISSSLQPNLIKLSLNKHSDCILTSSLSPFIIQPVTSLGRKNGILNQAVPVAANPLPLSCRIPCCDCS